MTLCQTRSRLESPFRLATPSMEASRFEQYARIAAAALLIFGCILVLRPFIGAILFAGVLCFSTWPAFTWLRDRWKGRSSLAALALVLAMVVALALPVGLAAQSLIVHSAGAVEAVRGFLDGESTLALPEFVVRLPLIGSWLARRLADPAKTMLVALGGAIGEGLIQILIAIFVAFFFYRDGERVRRLLAEGIARLAGPAHGVRLFATAQGAVKGVVYGLLGTAVAQSAVALIGFLIAGVPGAVVLAALTFVLSLVPMGPVRVWGGAAIWLDATEPIGWAIVMVV